MQPQSDFPLNKASVFSSFILSYRCQSFQTRMCTPASFGQRNHSPFLQVKACLLFSGKKCPKAWLWAVHKAHAKSIPLLAQNRQIKCIDLIFSGIPNFPTILRRAFFPEFQLLLQGVCDNFNLGHSQTEKGNL